MNTFGEWGAAIIVAIMFIIAYLAKVRKEGEAQARQIASRIGFSFTRQRLPEGIPSYFLMNAFPFYLKGNKEGVEILITWWNESDDDFAYFYIAACFCLQNAKLPEFRLAGKTWEDRMFYPDPLENKISFENHMDFAESYKLWAWDKDVPTVRDLFRPRMLSFFQCNKNWSVQSEGDWLVVRQVFYRKIKIWSNDRSDISAAKLLPRFLEDALQVYRFFLTPKTIPEVL